MSPPTNMQILNPSRRRPRVGDIFALKMSNSRYYFGRVVMFVPKMMPGGFKGPLIYIYKTSATKLKPPAKLHSKDLLCRPIATNFLPWSRGYFHFIENRPITPDDLIRQHSFFDPVNHCYRDENGKVLKRRARMSGFFGIDSFRTIDDSISKALGIPLAPD